MEVRIEKLVKQFGKLCAVDRITFSFSSGQIFGFVGPNGAGKTTTMRILATLADPTSGDAFIDGLSVVEEPEAARRKVGFMPDTLPAHRDMTVHEYLDFFARSYGLRGRELRSGVEQVESFTGLTALREKMLRSLSKGMKQRVSLARAIVHNPDVLILDEPAAGLDPRARIELRELLKALSEAGKAILISSHILTELSELCNGAVIIEQGRLLKAGTIDELVSACGRGKEVLIRPADGRCDEILRAVMEMPDVLNACVAGAEVAVELDGSPDNGAKILTALVQKGFLICEFRQKRSDLESVFMHVTKGRLQ